MPKVGISFLSNHHHFYRITSSILIILHVLTFGPIKDSFAFNAESANYKLNSGISSEGGGERAATSYNFSQDIIGESAVGKAQSASYILNGGFIPALETESPIQTQTIPNQSWQENTAKSNAFDLDDYFTSPDGLTLSYSVSGNNNIAVSIDSVTHVVSFSQAQAWFGTEKIQFTATDSESNSTVSNEVTLQVQGVNNSPVLDYIPDISVSENQLVTITPHATDLDGDTISYTYTSPINSSGQWQTNYNSAGTYTATVTATDSTGLKDTQNLIINVQNVNRAPVLNTIPDITANEGDLVTISPVAIDADNDAITFYYDSPIDTTGKWLTGYNDSGIYNVTITASDGIDTVSQLVTITVNNTNRAPEATLTLSKYTINPNETINVTLTASDPDDSNAKSFSIKKDGTEIASGNVTSTYSTSVSFADAGDHTVSATVTDSGGLSSTDSKGVDVVDPNANRNAINPIMGDFNGDAITDLGVFNSDTGKWEICLSDQGVFRNAQDWLSSFGTSRDWQPTGGDFNGDGKSDVGIYNNTNGQLQIALSSGSSFTAQGIWLTVSFASYSWQPFTGNFNGDKYTDFALYNKDTGEVKVALGTGAGFGPFNVWANSLGIGYAAMGGDFNGDSLTDICLFKKSSGEFKVAFSNTMGFVDGSTWYSGYAVNQDPLLADFNNDGLTDIGYWDKSTSKWYYAISTGTSFHDKQEWLSGFGLSTDESATTGDFDGNGITDAACFDRDQIGINRWTTQLSTNKPADLLTEIDNGIGGKTRITYTYASKFANNLLPFPVYVTRSTSLIDTLPTTEPQETYTQNFTYSGGYYDATEREFRGFAKIKTSDPITGNYTDTYFYQAKPGQDGALKGQIEKVLAYDGNGRQISETINTYNVKKSGPSTNVLGFPSLVEQKTAVWEENGSSLTTDDKFTYDNIGNVLQQTNEGDIAKSGDERSTVTTFAQAYENGFNRPTKTVLNDQNGVEVTKKTFEYDSKGNLSKDTTYVINPLTSTSTSSDTTYSYDSFGNLTSSTNALGHTVTTDYETTYYAYPQTVTNALGQSISYIYDVKFGVVASVTDTNGDVTSTAYDSLGRITQVTNALNQITATYSYPDFNSKISTNALNISSTEYIDGLGRKYKVVSSGEDGTAAKNIVSETYFNNRGQVSYESLPHYIDEDAAQISYIRYEYDIRGRLKKTISDFPGTLKDAESSINYVSPLYVEATDAQGHKKGTKKDIFGNNIEVVEFTSGGVFHTYYEYDIQNNLIKTTDSKGNVTEIFYDSIGKKLKMIDPDMGAWNYEYDALSNLTKQTDAKGQILTFEYDVLNRLTKKTRDDGNGATDSINYLYDDAAKQNCVGRLSKVTDLSGSTDFYYDILGREIKSIKIIDAISYTVERTYDVLDRLITLKYPDGELVTYSYDTNSGLLEKVNGSQNYVQDITYNAKGQIKTIKYGNGTQTDYTYGQDLRLSQILTQNQSQGTTLQNLNYIFDKNGNITTLTDNVRSNIRSYTYDDLDRLTQAANVPAKGGGYTTFNYQYDSIGNMTYKSGMGVMTYGLNAGPHALTSAGGYSYQYDVNGNMTVGKNKTLEYDVENRLTKVTELGTINTFLYDGDGGRVRKAIDDGGGTIVTTMYIGSLFEKDSDGTTRKHIFAGANRVSTMSLQGSQPPQAIYYHSDHLGSSSIISDASGNQISHYEYDPYGLVVQTEGSDSVRHKFTGKELDKTGLYFYGARYYDSQIGRFVTADTIVQSPYDPQNLNRYSYCRNNPIKYIDPTGHRWGTFLRSFIGAFVGGVVTGLAVVISGGALAPIAPLMFGAISGAVTGGLSGGWQGAMMGAGMGLAISGAVMIGGPLVAVGLLTGGAAYSYARGGGWSGVADFASGLAGGIIGGTSGLATGVGIGNTIKSNESLYAIGQTTSSKQTGQKISQQLKIDQKPRAVKIYGKGELSEHELKGALYGGKFYPAKVTKGGEKAFRVYGGASMQKGDSWTPFDPNVTPNFSEIMGLPEGNTKTSLIGGRMRPGARYVELPASPVGNNGGGATEWLLDNAKEDVYTELITDWNSSQ